MYIIEYKKYTIQRLDFVAKLCYSFSGYGTHPILAAYFYCFNPDYIFRFSSKPVTGRIGSV